MLGHAVLEVGDDEGPPGEGGPGQHGMKTGEVVNLGGKGGMRASARPSPACHHPPLGHEAVGLVPH
jgi:hypothetical protein